MKAEGISILFDHGLVILEEHLSMLIVLPAQLLAVLLVLDPLFSLVQGISLEVVDLLLSQRDSNSGQ